MAVYFIADTHFGDPGIIRYEDRPFKSVEAMDRELTRSWNQSVGADDTVYVLGDFACYDTRQQMRERVESLNGTKHLVMGNHDALSVEDYLEAGFTRVYDMPVILDDFFILSHEPLYVNSRMPYANIFGHVHGNPVYNTRSPHSSCVCVERTGYRPVSMNWVKRSLHQPKPRVKAGLEDFLSHQWEKADRNVLTYIFSFILRSGVAQEDMRSLFREVYDYEFANLLKAHYGFGRVCLAAPERHFVWQNLTGDAYDIDGYVSTQNRVFIPAVFLTDEKADSVSLLRDRNHTLPEGFIRELQEKFVKFLNGTYQ